MNNNYIVKYIIAWAEYENKIGWNKVPNGYNRNKTNFFPKLEEEMYSYCRNISAALTYEEIDMIQNISKEIRFVLYKKFINNIHDSDEIMQTYIDNYNIIG